MGGLRAAVSRQVAADNDKRRDRSATQFRVAEMGGARPLQWTPKAEQNSRSCAKLAAMHVFGLTGGVASGKSAVAEHFVALGTPVIDADLLAREAVAPPSPELDAIVRRFGSEMLTSTGGLDRRALATAVFGNPSAVKDLNAIVHPRVAALLAQHLAKLGSEGHLLVCYSAPLMFENQIADRFRPVVLVAAPQALQISRAHERDGWTEAETRARIAAQLPLAEKRAQADFVIDNGGTLQELQTQAANVLAEIRRRYGGAGPES